MLQLVRNPDSTVPAIIELRRQLDEFYATTNSYTAFEAPTDHTEHFELMATHVAELIRARNRIRVLELGAGKPTFPVYFKQHRDRIEYHVQDVTPQNRDYLQQFADQVHIGDIAQIQGQYDLVFSLFVLEHVSTPQAFLEHVSRLLTPGGLHIIFCPRYDMPGYLCPSLRHMGLFGRTGAMLFLMGSRLRTLLGGRPRFWVNCDPAMLHLPWYRDADAVHVVSQFDVVRWHRANGFDVQRLKGRASHWRKWVLERLLTLMLVCRKLDGSCARPGGPQT